jgi:hypothetical protein
MKFTTAISLVLAAILMVPAVSCLTGTILYFLWPVTAVNVFHAPPLTWWQAVVGYWTIGMVASAFKISVDAKTK